MAYGLPGKPGYTYTRPFDYFHFEFTSLGNADNLSITFISEVSLLGKSYEAGALIAGYGSLRRYDYISPHISVSPAVRNLLDDLSMVALPSGSTPGSYRWCSYAAAGNVAQVRPTRLPIASPPGAPRLPSSLVTGMLDLTDARISEWRVVAMTWGMEA